jgi:hypothetical protein
MNYRPHPALAGTANKRPAAPLVRDEEARAVVRVRLDFIAEPTYAVKALHEVGPEYGRKGP